MVHIALGIIILILLYFFYDDVKDITILALSIFALIGLLTDLLRMSSNRFNILLTKRLLPFLFSKNESEGINGATFFFFSSALCLLLFTKEIAITSVAILTLCDPTASITGRLFGKHKVGHKTIEGSLTFFIVAFILCIIYFPLWLAFVVAVVISIVELVSVRVDDNLAIPVVTGFLLTYLGGLF